MTSLAEENTYHSDSEEEIPQTIPGEFDKFSYEQLGEILGDDKQSITYRTRMLWFLRAISEKKPDDAVKVLANGFRSDSVLLKHEIAYVMGQIGATCAIPILNSVLANISEDCMVRHEAGEALGAIGDPSSIEFLSKYLEDPVREVRETIELAIENIQDMMQKKESKVDADFLSVDPAPAEKTKKPTAEVREEFLDIKLPLFKRYKAMFTLRNRANKGDKPALMALCDGFREEDGALFKHEVAFVLGQLQKHETAQTLETVLMNEKEHAMVRHEAAEALGSIADPRTLKLLEQFQQDKEDAVRDSCIVAVDMHQYWSKFQNTDE